LKQVHKYFDALGKVHIIPQVINIPIIQNKGRNGVRFGNRKKNTGKFKSIFSVGCSITMVNRASGPGFKRWGHTGYRNGILFFGAAYY